MTEPTPSTAAAYERAWAQFERWAGAAGESAIPPIAMSSIAAYVGSWPATLGSSGRKLRMAGIAWGHQCAGVPWQPRDPAVAALIRTAAANPDTLAQQLACCADSVAGLRDRVLLLLHHRAGLTQEQIAALDHADLRWHADGVEIRLGRAGAAPSLLPIARRRGDPSCLVAVLEDWLRVARIRYGAVVPRLGRHGWPEGALDRRGVRLLLRAIAQRAAAVAGTLPAQRAPVAGAWRGPAHRKVKAVARKRAAGRT